MEIQKLHSVIAMLDEKSTHIFINLRRELSTTDEHYDNTLPHITISMYEKYIDLNELIQWTKQIAENHFKFQVIYKIVGYFPHNCIMAVPAFSPKLYELYKDHHQKYDECCRPYNMFKNGEWLPHTGIMYANKKEDAIENIGKIAEIFPWIEAEIVSLRISEFANNTFNKIIEFELKNL